VRGCALGFHKERSREGVDSRGTRFRVRVLNSNDWKGDLRSGPVIKGVQDIDQMLALLESS
jgi:hypothetical protein